MKAVGCVVVVLLVLVGGFFAFTAFTITRGGDQSALTERIELTVIAPQEKYDSTVGEGYRFDYAYERDGQWYGGDDWVADDYWTPQAQLVACVNPDEPREHVLTYQFEKCGQESIVNGKVRQGEPRSAP